MAISQETLQFFSSRYKDGMGKRASYRYSFSDEQNPTIFLCHSHRDVELVKGLIAYFNLLQIKLYIDWLDEEMPECPNRETAVKIQKRITEADYFFFLATENSKASRWCPWEMGFADGIKKNIYIIPTLLEKNTLGNEYLQLYSHVDIVYTRGYDTGSYLGKYDTNNQFIGRF